MLQPDIKSVPSFEKKLLEPSMGSNFHSTAWSVEGNVISHGCKQARVRNFGLGYRYLNLYIRSIKDIRVALQTKLTAELYRKTRNILFFKKQQILKPLKMKTAQ